MPCQLPFRTCIAVLFVISMVFRTSHAQTLSPEDLLSPVDISHDVYGFNGEYMMDQCFDSDDPYSSPQLPYTSIYLSPSCRELVDEVSPGILRFPGGITANFYHFYGDGYGFRFSETFGNAIGPVDPSLDNLMPVNFIEPFADLALQTNSKVIFTLNLYTHFRTGGSAVNDFSSIAYLNKLNENMAALQYLTDRGINIVGIELGNEMYNHVELTGPLNLDTAPAEYLAIAENYSDTIRSKFPGIPIGIPIAIHKGGRNKTWNEQMQAADFAEGRVIHEYERIVWNNCDLITDRDEYFECAKLNIEAFFDTDFRNTMEEYMALYPGKELWLTEWGMAQAHKVANTFFDAYYNFKYWNKYMEFEELNPGAIAFALRHNLISSGWSYSAFSQKYQDESAELYYNGNKTIHASAYSHKLMKDIFDGDHQYIGHVLLDSCDAWIYRNAQHDFKIAIINESTTQRVFTAQEIATALGFGSMEIMEYSRLAADYYHSAAGISGWVDSLDLPLTNKLNYAGSVPADNPEQLDIKGLSLTVVHLEVTREEPVVPAITNFSAVLQENCSFNITWSVEDEIPEGHYDILAGVETGTLNVVGTIAPSQHEAQADYQFSYQPLGNEHYTFRIERHSPEVLQAATNDTSIEVTCVASPDPYLLGFRLNAEENCAIRLHWQIGDENENGFYHIFLTTGDEPPSQIATVTSTGPALIASYQYIHATEVIGDHSFVIRRYEGSYPDFNTNNETITAECKTGPDPSLVSASLSPNEDCTLSIDWKIADENNLGQYAIMLSLNGSPYTAVDYVPSQSGDSPVSYNYSFIPEVNGLYQFRIDRLDDGNISFSSDPLTHQVECIASGSPEIVNVGLVETDCSLMIDWQVSSENAASEYQVYMSIDGGDFEIIASVSSEEAAEFAEYSLLYPLEQNGNYALQIVRTEGGEFLAASEILFTEISCIQESQVLITSLTATADESCRIEVAWHAEDQQGDVTYLLYVSSSIEAGETPQLLAAIPATHGNSHNYSYQFVPPASGEYLFQLQVLESGQALANYSTGWVNTDCSMIPEVSLSVGPHVTFGEVEVTVNANMTIEAELRIIKTNTGAVLVEELIFLQAGSQVFIYNISDYPNAGNGIYHIVVTWSHGSSFEQFIYAGG